MSAVAIVLTSAKPAAFAEDIRVLSAAAMQSVLKEVGSEFERSSGHRLVINYGTMGAINQRVLDGETSDLIIGSSQSIAGRVKLAGSTPIASWQSPKSVLASLCRDIPSSAHFDADELRKVAGRWKTVVFANTDGGGNCGYPHCRCHKKNCVLARN